MGVKCLAQSRCWINGSGDMGRSEGSRGNPSRQGVELHSWYMGSLEQPSSGRENETNFLPEREPGFIFHVLGVRMRPEAQHSAQLRKAGSREAPEHRNRSCKTTGLNGWGTVSRGLRRGWAHWCGGHS